MSENQPVAPQPEDQSAAQSQFPAPTGQPVQQPYIPTGQPVQQPQSMQQPYAPTVQPMPQPQPMQQPYASTGQPRQQPQPAVSDLSRQDEPVRYRVHHSYVWLGTLRAGLTIFLVTAASVSSSLMGAIAEGKPGSNNPNIMTIIILACCGGFVLLMGILFLVQWWSYKHIYYELGSEEFSLYSGIFNKKRVHVPYQRIQSVDQHASLLQRVFGVCSVSIDTAGGASNKAVRVPYVQKAQAEELRRTLFARKQYQIAVNNGANPAAAAAAVAAASGISAMPFPSAGFNPSSASASNSNAPGVFPNGNSPQAPSNVLDAPAELWDEVRGVFGGVHIDTGKVTYEYGMSNKELVLTGLSNNTTFFLIILGIIGAVAQFAGEILPLLFEVAEPVANNVISTGTRMFQGNFIAFGVVAFLLIALALWVLSAIGSCISFGGFHACRRDNRIEVEYGLLQHRFQGVDVDRVQSVVVKQSFIRRLMGYCELSLGKIDAAAENSNEQQKSSLSTRGLIIHPFVKLDRVPEILAGIIPEFADVPTDSTPVARVGLRRAIIRRCIVQGTGFWLAVVVAITQIIMNAVVQPTSLGNITMLQYVNMGAAIAYVLCVVLLILDAVGAVLWFRGSGFSYNDEFMQVSNGGFARETVSFPRKKIQFGHTRTNPFQRRAHTATVNARTAAGIGGTTVRLIDVSEEDATAWLTWLKPRRNMI